MQAFTFLVLQTLESVFLPVNVGDRHSIGTQPRLTFRHRLGLAHLSVATISSRRDQRALNCALAIFNRLPKGYTLRALPELMAANWRKINRHLFAHAFRICGGDSSSGHPR